jgi:hypothetical protein
MSCSCNVDAACAAPLSPSSCPTQSLRDVRSCLARPAPPRRLIKLPARLFLFQLGEVELGALRPAVRRAEQCTPQTWMLRCTTATSSRFHADARSLSLSFLFSIPHTRRGRGSGHQSIAAKGQVAACRASLLGG